MQNGRAVSPTIDGIFSTAAPDGQVFSEEFVFTPPQLPRQFDEAVLPVDKPAGWTSFDVVKKLRGMLRVRKIGHAGTLDPMATGLLICLVGKATKRMETFMQLEKTYEGVLRLGETTPSYDAETEVDARSPVAGIDEQHIQDAFRAHTGEIEQVPPMYSAVKVRGERLYKKARRGENVERPSRKVFIYAFECIERVENDVRFAVRCSKGTYIRTLAHDVGAYLGAGAHLVALRRTAIGPISVDSAWSLEALSEAVASMRDTG